MSEPNVGAGASVGPNCCGGDWSRWAIGLASALGGLLGVGAGLGVGKLVKVSDDPRKQANFTLATTALLAGAGAFGGGAYAAPKLKRLPAGNP